MADTTAARGDTGAAAAPGRALFRLPELDGYRSIAAIAVLVFHVATATRWHLDGVVLGFDAGAWASRLGNWGVCVFFLLSGFLLYRPYVTAHLTGRQGPGWSTFVRRRVFRIFPLYWTVLTLVYVFDATTPPPRTAAEGWWTQIPLYLLFQNYVDGLDSLGLPVAWTLCIEWSFYLMLPGIAWLICRLPGGRTRNVRNRMHAQLFGLALMFVVAWTFRIYVVQTRPDWPGVPQNWVFNYLDWFALGMLFALAHAWAGTGRRLPRLVVALADQPWICWLLTVQCYWVGVLLNIPTSLVIPSEPGQTFGRFAVNGLSAFFLLLPGMLGSRKRTRPGLVALASAPMVWLGTVSYGIYLWHTPIIKKIKQYDADPTFLALLAATLVGTLLLSWLSYHLVERPALSLKDGRSLHPRWRRLLTSSQPRRRPT